MSYQGKPVTIHGVYYATRTAAAEALGVSIGTINSGIPNEWRAAMTLHNRCGHNGFGEKHVWPKFADLHNSRPEVESAGEFGASFKLRDHSALFIACNISINSSDTSKVLHYSLHVRHCCIVRTRKADLHSRASNRVQPTHLVGQREGWRKQHQGYRRSFTNFQKFSPSSTKRLSATVISGSVNPRQQKTVVGVSSPSECKRVEPALFTWVFAIPASWAGFMVTRGGVLSGTPSSLAFSGLLTRRCVATRLVAGRHVHLNARRPLMSAHQQAYLTKQQIRRLLQCIVTLPCGPRRDRFFRYFMRSNAPALIAKLYPDWGQNDVA